MASSLLCALSGLISLCIIALILWVLWWGLTSLLAAFGIGVPAQLVVILKVLAVLILVFFIVRAVLTGDYCGFFASYSPSVLHR